MNYDKVAPKKYQVYTAKNFKKIKQLECVPDDVLTSVDVVSKVFAFKTNNYVVDELINWEKVPDDPIFRLVFPQKGMLSDHEYSHMKSLVMNSASPGSIRANVASIHKRMNPHPAGQMELNVPESTGIRGLSGVQHKYDETVLFFPSQGQTCHAFCTYCFRWPQFSGLDNYRFASKNVDALIRYIEMHPEITDLLITGGDPLVMSAKVLEQYIDPVLKSSPGNLSTIRIGTKVPAYWPYRFLTDNDSDDLMRLFSRIAESGYHLALMAHYTHYRELETPAAEAAVKRLRQAGAVIRSQSPVVRHINDNPEVWSRMWEIQAGLGVIPYYMFVQRNTGPRSYFSLPLKQAYDIFTESYKGVSGLKRTVRGPSMSAAPGKVLVEGITGIRGEKYFVLKFIQARNPEWVNRIFFAEYDERACWLDELTPAFGEQEFFFDLRDAA
ncbi:MAG: lysine 2,3-aminomutase [Desulfobacteraceae bacterium]